MKKSTVVFELTDREIRAFWFSAPLFPFFIKPRLATTTVNYDRIPIPTGIIEQGNMRDESVVIDCLSAFRSKLSGVRQKAYIAIPQQQGFIRAYSLPWLSRRHRTSALALLVDEEISIARSDLLYDFLVISEEKSKEISVLLGATRQSIVEQFVSIFERAGFEVSGVDFAFSVLGQALKFDVKEDVLYLQGESGCFQIALFRGEVPESVRSLLPPSVKAGNQYERDWIEEGENEIGRFILYNKTQQRNLSLKRLIWCGDSITEQLAKRLLVSNRSLVGAQATLKAIPDSWQKILEQHVGRCEVVVGYGQRILAQLPVLNLWKQPSWVKRQKRRYLRLVSLVGVLLVIGTILGLFLNQMSSSLESEVDLLSRQGTETEWSTKQQQAVATAWNGVLVRTEKMGEALAKVQALSGTGLTIKQVIFKQDSMSLSGTSLDSGSVQALISNLRTLGWEQPALTSYKLSPMNKVEFSITTGRGKKE